MANISATFVREFSALDLSKIAQSGHIALYYCHRKLNLIYGTKDVIKSCIIVTAKSAKILSYRCCWGKPF